MSQGSQHTAPLQQICPVTSARLQSLGKEYNNVQGGSWEGVLFFPLTVAGIQGLGLGNESDPEF